jgi:predicted sugar kinase
MENVSVKCIVESNPLTKEYEGYPIVRIEELPDDVETIIVIPYYESSSIKEKVHEQNKNVAVMGIDEWIDRHQK